MRGIRFFAEHDCRRTGIGHTGFFSTIYQDLAIGAFAEWRYGGPLRRLFAGRRRNVARARQVTGSTRTCASYSDDGLANKWAKECYA
jgi:hypothetical protein